jgi:hypothetical protein
MSNTQMGSTGGTGSNGIYANIQERNAQSLTDIQSLQTIEQELFSQLEQGIATNSLTAAQQSSIVTKINEISQMRINLYQNLNGSLTFSKLNVASTNNTLVEQGAAIQIVENELNSAKKRLQAVESDRDDKLRMVEINTYYGDKYADQTSIMQLVVIICIPIIILTIFVNKGIISRSIYSILMAITIFVSLYYLWPRMVRYFSHDNMIYDEYTWDFNPDSPNLPTVDTTSTPKKNPWVIPSAATCVGQACCSTGFIYQSSINQCAPVGMSTDENVIGNTTSLLESAANSAYNNLVNAFNGV